MAPNAHARLSPSSASRWLRCPGSVNFLAEYAEDEGGIPAAEGTILHSFCEDALRTNTDAYEFVGETREHDRHKLTLTDDLADMMQEGLDEIDRIPGKLYIEHRVKLDRWMPGDFGTLDVGIINKRRIHIWDWKWGFLPVLPNSEQLKIYALGFWDNIARHLTDVEDFRLHIFQPRAPGGGGSHDITLDELLAFGKEIKRKAKLTHDKNAPRIPGPTQCHYCDGAKLRICPEYDAYIRACKDIRKFVTVRTVKGGALAGMTKSLVDDWVEVRDRLWMRQAWLDGDGEDEMTPVKRKSRPRPVPVSSGGEYLGKAIRWYYSAEVEGAIHYNGANKSGNHNKVPRSDGARPLMELPDEFPDDIDYQRYVKDARDILEDIGHSRSLV